ncbi:MAG: ribosomal-protein-alanine N-acetyltransferase [Limisphaerales bacterium]
MMSFKLANIDSIIDLMRIYVVSEKPEFIELVHGWTREYGLHTMTCNPVKEDSRLILPVDAKVIYYESEDSNSLIGRMVFSNWNPRNFSMQFSFIVDPDFVTWDVSSRMVDHAISNFFGKRVDVKKLYCLIPEYNDHAVHCLKSLGFRLDGTLRDHHELKGKLYGERIYSVMRSEWSAELR